MGFFSLNKNPPNNKNSCVRNEDERLTHITTAPGQGHVFTDFMKKTEDSCVGLSRVPARNGAPWPT
jgi:hypothetical protein